MATEGWAPVLAAIEAIGRGAYERVALDDLSETDGPLAEVADALRRAAADVAAREAGLRQSRHDAVHRLVVAAEYRDQRTLEHIERMSSYTALLARRMGLPERDVEMIREASAMHDVGKIGIPEHILLKPGQLDPEEWEVMRQHAEIGAVILRDTMSDLLIAGEQIARSHHERWDGSGYPEGLAGESIPLWGRICAIADVFDALTSERPYKRAYDAESAFATMAQGRGTHFDPRLLDLFFEAAGDVQRIRAHLPA
ncbi:MAG: HD domain-containing protein [Armatimonadetes bacterium]|nr:HD domain-containing protein [Armatimonadota bacterium]